MLGEEGGVEEGKDVEDEVVADEEVAEDVGDEVTEEEEDVAVDTRKLLLSAEHEKCRTVPHKIDIPLRRDGYT